MGLAFFHTHIHGIDRFFPPQKERYVSFFRVILRNFHESNRFFFLLSSLLSPSTIGYQTRIFRDSLGHFSDNSVRREKREKNRFAGSIKPEDDIGEERGGKRKSIRKKGWRRRRRARRRRLRPVWKRTALRAPINRSSWKQILRYRPCVTGSSFHF